MKTLLSHIWTKFQNFRFDEKEWKRLSTKFNCGADLSLNLVAFFGPFLHLKWEMTAEMALAIATASWSSFCTINILQL